MTFASGLSEHPLATQAVGEAIGQVLDGLGDGPPPDLAAIFVSAAHVGAIDDIANAVRTVLGPAVFVGTTAVSVVAGAREVEDGPAIALWAARLRVRPAPVRLTADTTPDGWMFSGLSPAPANGETLLVLADPFSFPVGPFVDHVDAVHRGLAVVGGLASAARGPGGNRLVLDGQVHADGAVGVVLPAAAATTAIVSQGCRPVGDPMIVTRAERNVIYELAGQPALTRLLRIVEAASPAERARFQNGLHVGIVVDEQQATFGPGDFVVRNVLGADREAGAVAIGDEVAVGSTVQFHVRDAEAADEDLRAVLDGRTAQGALLFTCTGRGVQLFGQPDHDAEIVAATVRGADAGMFCAGEIGPVGSRSFLHGFTASVLLFDEGPAGA